jgi:hypothetical protein
MLLENRVHFEYAVRILVIIEDHLKPRDQTEFAFKSFETTFPVP